MSRTLALAVLLARRDLRVRYKATALGLTWALGVPLLLAGVFHVVYQVIFRAGIDRYPLFVLSGLLPWIFLQGALATGAQSYLASAEIVKRIPFPRAAAPLGAVLAEAFHLAAGLGLLVALAPALGGRIGPALAALVPAYALIVLAAGGGALALAPLQARYRDVKYLVDLGLMLAFYATPIVYTTAMVPRAWRPLVAANPVAALLAPFRAALLDGAWPGAAAWAAAGAVVAGAWLLGAAVHRRLAETVADHV